MYQVIICTISNGRVQRKSFDNWDLAQQCSERWMAKNINRRTYAVSIERVEKSPMWKKTDRSIGM